MVEPGERGEADATALELGACRLGQGLEGLPVGGVEAAVAREVELHQGAVAIGGEHQRAQARQAAAQLGLGGGAARVREQHGYGKD